MKTIFAKNMALHRDSSSKETMRFGVKNGVGRTEQRSVTFYGGAATTTDANAAYLVDELGWATYSLGGTNEALKAKADAEELFKRALRLEVIDKADKNYRFDKKVIASRQVDLLELLMTNGDLAGSVDAACAKAEKAIEEAEARKLTEQK